MMANSRSPAKIPTNSLVLRAPQSTLDVLFRPDVVGNVWGYLVLLAVRDRNVES